VSGGFLQFYRYTEVSNLYTAGGEFKTANGQNYIGDYHIHDSIGPMIGKTHTKEPHGNLFPINDNIIPRIQTSMSIPISGSNITPTQLTYTPSNINIGGGGGGY